MPKALKWWLAVWGVLGFLALAAPGLVAVGLFFIVPGLVLLAAPTIFLYSALFALFLRLLRAREMSPMLSVVAAGLALLAGWAVPQPWARAERRAFEEANLPQIVPLTAVTLAGDVHLELPSRAEPCPALCAALLDTPGVRSVTVVAAGAPSADRQATFRLIPRADRTPGAWVSAPAEILDHLPAKAREGDKSLVAMGWALRLASREKLVREGAPASFDTIIRIQKGTHSARQGVAVSAVEVFRGVGKALLRRSVVSGSALSAPLSFTGTGGLENFRMGLSRDHLANGPTYPELPPVAELFRHTSLARPKVDPEARAAALTRLRAATADRARAADDPDFAIARLWLPTVDWREPLPPEELAVLSGVIADERIAVTKQLYDGYEQKVAPELRAALGKRIVHVATPEEARRQLVRLLVRMPPGAFAVLTPDEENMLADQRLRPEIYPLIARSADRGVAAVPGLLAILNNDSKLPYYQRRLPMRAVALAFAILGEKAAETRGELEDLLSVPRSPVREGNEHVWNLALARMGKRVEEFRWYSDEPKVVERERKSLRLALERFDPYDPWRNL